MILDELGKYGTSVLRNTIGGAALGFGVGAVSDALGGTEHAKWAGALIGGGIGLYSDATSSAVKRVLYNELKGEMAAPGLISAYKTSRLAAEEANSVINAVRPGLKSIRNFFVSAGVGYGAGAALDATGLTDSASGWGLTLGAGYGFYRGARFFAHLDANEAMATINSTFNKFARPMKHA